MKYTVRYYKRSPVDPQDKLTIHREIIEALSEQDVRDTFQMCDCDVIDVVSELAEQQQIVTDVLMEMQPRLEAVLDMLEYIETPAPLPELVKADSALYCTSYQPSHQELAKRFDWTPEQKMPVIDMDTVEEVRF